MKLMRLFKAVFQIRNIALLAAIVIITYLTEYLPFALVGAAGYLFFVLQSYRDKALDGNDTGEDKINSLIVLDTQCNALYQDARKRIDRQYQNKVKSILQDKDELLELFHRDPDNFVRQKLVEQVIRLVMAFIQLIIEYGQRRNEVARFNAAEINEAIEANERKLKVMRDAQAIEDIRNAVEMDRRVLERIDHEKRELEKMSARLTYIESTLKTFKHQVFASDNTDEVSKEIESIINEAAALDHVLDSRRNDRLKI